MSRNNEDAGKRNLTSRIFHIVLLMIILFSISAPIVEAKAIDTIKTGIGKARVFVASPAFWANTVLIFGFLFILYALLLSQKVGSDSSLRIVMYLLLIIIAVMLATKIVDAGKPQYFWKDAQTSRFTQFMIGPPKAVNTNDCNGDGAYYVISHGTKVCRQALLRINSNASGLPAFILSTILFYLLFIVFRSQLGIDKTGSSGSKWLPVFLASVLGALVANQGVSKDAVIITGGWVMVLFVVGKTLAEKFTDENDEKGTKKAFGFGLGYAFVELIANMLGTTLFGNSILASDIDIWLVLTNIGIGSLLGIVYAYFTMPGTLSLAKKDLPDKDRREIEALEQEGNYVRAALRKIAVIGSFFSWLKPTKDIKDQMARDEQITSQLSRLYPMLEQMRKTKHFDPVKMMKLRNFVLALEEELAKEQLKQAGMKDERIDNTEKESYEKNNAFPSELDPAFQDI